MCITARQPGEPREGSPFSFLLTEVGMQFQEALTFDDVLLKPAASAVPPNQPDTRTTLSRTLQLRTPLLSAAIDNVTDAAIPIATDHGRGIAVLHMTLRPTAPP